jgi:hypothetical protein
MKERKIQNMLYGDDRLISFTSDLILSWRVAEIRRKENEKVEERLLKQAMLALEWKTRREMMMEIDPAEMTLSKEHQQGGDMELIDGMKMMTIWTDIEWEGIESIEHRNVDIIMEDLGVTLVDPCMEVDVETAWREMEMMEGILCDNNTHSQTWPPKEY